MMIAQTKAITKPYSAIVKPTDKASIEVAIPCTNSSLLETVFSIGASSFRDLCSKPSMIILPPIYISRPKPIHGTIFSKAEKIVMIVWTQNQPIKGIAAWKKAKQPAIRFILSSFICGSWRPLAKETEKASIAKATPKAILFTKNKISIFLQQKRYSF